MSCFSRLCSTRSALLPKMHLMRNSEDERLFSNQKQCCVMFFRSMFWLPWGRPCYQNCIQWEVYQIKGSVQIKNIPCGGGIHEAGWGPARESSGISCDFRNLLVRHWKEECSSEVAPHSCLSLPTCSPKSAAIACKLTSSEARAAFNACMLCRSAISPSCCSGSNVLATQTSITPFSVPRQFQCDL